MSMGAVQMVNLLPCKLGGHGQGCTCYAYNCLNTVQMLKQLPGKLGGDGQGCTCYMYEYGCYPDGENIVG